MNSREHVLIRKCQAGDSEAFGALYDTYVKKVYTFIYYKTHHKETAEDLTSQTFFKALEHIHTFNSERTFSSWLYKIAQNTVIDHYRKIHPTRPIEDAWDLHDNTDILRDLDALQKIERVKEYLEQLPSIQRDIVLLRVWEELPYKEIAEIVGRNEANCKVIFSRAIANLKTAVPASIILFLTFYY